MEFIILAVILVILGVFVWLFARPKDDIAPPQPQAPYKIDFDLSSMAPAFPEKSKEIELDPDATPFPPLTRSSLHGPDTTNSIKLKSTNTLKATKKPAARKSAARSKPGKPKILK